MLILWLHGHSVDFAAHFFHSKALFLLRPPDFIIFSPLRSRLTRTETEDQGDPLEELRDGLLQGCVGRVRGQPADPVEHDRQQQSELVIVQLR